MTKSQEVYTYIQNNSCKDLDELLAWAFETDHFKEVRKDAKMWQSVINKKNKTLRKKNASITSAAD
jgi:hypothetical protein